MDNIAAATTSLLPSSNTTEYLKVHAPGTRRQSDIDVGRERAPVILNFSRTRDIKLSWDKLSTPTTDLPSIDLRAMKNMIEAMWGFRPDQKPDTDDFIIKVTPETPFAVYVEESRSPLRVRKQSIESGAYLLRDLSSGKYYWPKPKPAANVQLGSEEEYEASWSNSIGSIIEAFPQFESITATARLNTPTVSNPTMAGGGSNNEARENGEPPYESLKFGSAGTNRWLDRSFRVQAVQSAIQASGIASPASPLHKQSDEPSAALRPSNYSEDIVAWRRHLERNWGGEPYKEPQDIQNFIYPAVAEEPTPAAVGEPAPIASTKLYVRGKLDPSAGMTGVPWTREELPVGAIIIRAGSRLWHAKPRKGESFELLGAADFYDYMWKFVIEKIEPVWDQSSSADPELKAWCPWSSADEIDLDVQAIVHEYRELAATAQFASVLSTKADAIPNTIDANVVSPVEIERALLRFQTLKMRGTEVEEKLRRLQSRALRLGYFLALKDNEEPPFPKTTAPGLPASSVKQGTLYRGVQREFTWTETITVPVTYNEVYIDHWTTHHTGVLFWRRSYNVPHYKTRTAMRLENRSVQRLTTYITPIPVELDAEPWEKRRRELETAGHLCYVFDLTDRGYRSVEGDDLEQVMEHAFLDEGFRRKLVVFLPAYEQKLTEGTIKTKYLAIRAPTPGNSPVGVPRLMIEEHMSYRSEWIGTELGELLQSINLAPGEKRTVSVSRTFNRKRSESRSITSVLDVTESSSEDLASSIENEARNEREDARTSGWNVKAAGSYGAFSAEGNASGSSTMTAKDFARQVQSMAKKAAQTLTRSSKQEVHTETRSEESYETKESNVGDILNINQGRTLNLFFYRLNNVYKSGIFLENLKIVVVPTREVIAGSGIRIPLTFRFHEIRDALETLSGDLLFAESYGIKPAQLAANALDKLIVTIMREYHDAPEGSSTSNRQIGFAESLGVLTELSLHNQERNDDKPNERTVVELLERLTVKNIPVEPHTLIVPSRAVYLDSMVGESAATEPYSELMRTAELAERNARIEEAVNRAALIRAAAGARSRVPGSSSFTLRSPRLLDAVRADERLAIMLSAPLQHGIWQLYFGDTLVNTSGIPLDERQFELSIDSNQILLSGDLLKVLQFVEVASGVRVDSGVE